MEGPTPRHPYWPIFDIVVRTPRLELRPVREADVWQLIELADRGIHDPATMPFGIPWTDARPPELWWNTFRHHAESWAGLSPERWNLTFAVRDAGELVGCQAALAEGFPERRSAETGSWVGKAHQGGGIGTEMRVAVLAFLFEGLGATEARTSAWFDNERSLGVTRRVGYEPDGEELKDRRGEQVRHLLFRMSRERWEARRADIGGDHVHLQGVEAALPLLGLA